MSHPFTHFCTPKNINPIGECSLQPIPLDDFEALAITLGFPTRGLQSKVMKFLDDQVRPFLSARIAPNPDPEYLYRRLFPGFCKRKSSLASTLFFVFLRTFPTYTNCTLPVLPSPFLLLVCFVSTHPSRHRTPIKIMTWANARGLSVDSTVAQVHPC